MFYLMSIKQWCEAMIYNNGCLFTANIVKVSQQVQSDHPDKPMGRIPEHLLNVIGYWLQDCQGKMVTTGKNFVSLVGLYAQIFVCINLPQWQF